MKSFLFTDCIDLVGSACKPFKGKRQFVSTGAVDTDHVVESDTETVDFETKPSRANLEVKAGDVLFAKMQGTKKTLLIDDTRAEYIYSTGFCAVKGKQGILTNRCLYHLLTSETFLLQKDKNCSGATQKAITNTGLSKIRISLPKFDKQEEVADQLDAITRVIYMRQRELFALDELIKARFVEMFRTEEYQIEKLGKICLKITDGTHKTPTYLQDGVTFISAKNIVNGELNFSDVKYISENEYQEIQKRCQTERMDILLSKSGSLGSPAIVRTEEKLGLFESLAVLKYDRRKLIPEFLCEQLKTDRIQRQFTVGTKGVAIKHLHLGVIADTDIVVPPIEKQKAFAIFVTQVDKSKVIIKAALEKAQMLFDSLMQQYFG